MSFSTGVVMKAWAGLPREGSVFEADGYPVGGGMIVMRGVYVACFKLLVNYHGLPHRYHVVGDVVW